MKTSKSTCACGSHALFEWSPATERRYFQEAIKLTAQDRIEQQLLNRLPNVLIDAHVHTTPGEAVTTRDARIATRLMSTFPAFDLEMSSTVSGIMWQHKDVRRLRIPTPYFGIDFRIANKYLAAECPPNDVWALLGAPNDIAATLSEMKTYSGSFVALKMYPFAEGVNGNTVKDVFPIAVLEKCEEANIPIVLHLPAPLSIVAAELAQIMADLKTLRVVLAHIGIIAEQPVDQRLIEFDALRTLAANTHLFVDTAMVMDWEVILFALRVLGPEKVLFGSDEPLSCIRALPFNHPERGPWMSPGLPYHWMASDDAFVCAVALNCAPLSLWSGIRAVLLACDGHLGPATEVSQQVFFDNANRLFFQNRGLA